MSLPKNAVDRAVDDDILVIYSGRRTAAQQAFAVLDSSVPLKDADPVVFLLRMQQGERQALSQLYTLTAAKLFAKLLGIALRIVRRRAVAEDVLQDAIV
ncbi:MAG: hypothetical protein ACYCXG_11725 [Acidiferrobacter sp.]